MAGQYIRTFVPHVIFETITICGFISHHLLVARPPGDTPGWRHSWRSAEMTIFVKYRVECLFPVGIAMNPFPLQKSANCFSRPEENIPCQGY
jgi:hypothetical protein